MAVLFVKLPASQTTHAVAPLWFWYMPTGQRLQATDAGP
jgi:hypothetical protein